MKVSRQRRIRRRTPCERRGWVTRLSIFLLYSLILAGSPIARGGILGWHLATAHHADHHHESVDAEWNDAYLHAPGDRQAHDFGEVVARGPKAPDAHPHADRSDQRHGHPNDHPHDHPHRHLAQLDPPRHHSTDESGAEHSRYAGSEARHESEPRPASRSIALHEPHEHGGRVHTHHPGEDPDDPLLTDSVSKHYLYSDGASGVIPQADSSLLLLGAAPPLPLFPAPEPPPPRSTAHWMRA